MIKKQDDLRKQVKIAKALNDDWSYKTMSEAIDITPNAFYNWLNGYYELSRSKEKELCGLVEDLITE